MEDHWVEVDKRFLVIAPEVDCPTKIASQRPQQTRKKAPSANIPLAGLGFSCTVMTSPPIIMQCGRQECFLSKPPGRIPWSGCGLARPAL